MGLYGGAVGVFETSSFDKTEDAEARTGVGTGVFSRK